MNNNEFKETIETESEENKYWSRIAMEQFFSEEDDSDSIFDYSDSN